MYYKAIFILAAIILALALEQSVADVTSSNATSNNTSTTGSNTAIHGYEATTNYNSGSNPVTTNTTTNSTNNNSKTASAPANAPSTQIYSSNSCTIAYSGALSTVTFGIAGSSYYHDPYCERRMLAKQLHSFGLRVGALALLCQDPNVRRALYEAASYCPHSGSIGLQAKAKWDAENKSVTNQVDQYRKYKESLNNE
ncbi:hypothetical protein [uncultured phage_MedDCM-OCT-S28-C10]|uniref:Uncharacterized protein n=1 Tax=uncultured phage_MedDCM-OCT-S28-C10 TaxID=2741077 RepID=A0A6S4PI55_9CAUD|nr:hypothetical protein HOQ60_gp13 [uncultured phage_MedDCM-OCT-S28-C10]BAQ94056.1 hypothetical protein [uncultured phage_MedDCM-OCT-S28-C10]BAR25258.1 hypothetical protein [uncultured Mediterranean phage uvMED]BAR25331.1 hypothetical protein [uncultured Mediterranean phage uvMED]